MLVNLVIGIIEHDAAGQDVIEKDKTVKGNRSKLDH